jgi:RHS repeat-associated protein
VRTVLDERHEIAHTTDLLGREIMRVLPRGGSIETAYDPLERLVQRRAFGMDRRRATASGEPAWIGATDESATARTSYRYDAAGEIIETSDKKRGSVEYRYDPLGQLLDAVPEKGPPERFAYDAAGNVHETGRDAPRREYGKGNRLARRGDAVYQWDEEGRLTSKEALDADGRPQIWRYNWSPTGLLQSVLTPDEKIVEHFYDPLSRRVLKRVSTAGHNGQAKELIATTRFVWDGDVLVHEIRQAAPIAKDAVTEVRTYCFEDDSFTPLAHRVGTADHAEGDWAHYLTDHVGTPESIVASDGALVEQLDHRGFRVAPTTPGPLSTPLRFPGQYEDLETGLAYNRFRYYDPSLGIFVSADPLGLDAGLNAFAYCPNSLMWLDPLGLAGTMKRRRRMAERIRAAQEAGGNQTVKGSISPREARRLCREHAGAGATQGRARNGADMRTSADGRTRSRGASEKRSEHTRTGTQINLESGRNLDQSPDRQVVDSNVHVDVKR